MTRLLFVTVLVSMLLSDRAAAVVVEVPVTPESIKEPDSRFSITAEKRKDGLVHFKIVYRLQEARHLVARVEVRDGETVIVKSDTPCIVRENEAVFYVAAAPRYLRGLGFRLDESHLSTIGGKAEPSMGGTIYKVKLGTFYKAD